MNQNLGLQVSPSFSAPLQWSSSEPVNVGGSSGGSNGSNVLSMNVGGVSVNYDLGPNTDEMAQNAYNYLGNSMSADAALLGNTILGSQSFVSGFATPFIGMAQEEQNFNTQVLPSMFGSLNAQNYSVGEQAIGAESDIAKASIAASQAEQQTAASESGGGGGCYITTAICREFNLPDDCEQLTKLRAFRDGFMTETSERRELVRRYYDTAPRFVRALERRSDHREIFQRLSVEFLYPAIDAIDSGNLKRALRIYQDMYEAVKLLVSEGEMRAEHSVNNRVPVQSSI